jgi:hypothetical protein
MLNRHEELEHYSNYSEYSKTLRAWLVAYGIGAPVLVATNEQIYPLFKAANYRTWIVSFFLLGVAGQILLGFINKWCAYHMYLGECKPRFQQNSRYKFWNWLNDRSWIDLAIDSASILAFAIATLLFLQIVL